MTSAVEGIDLAGVTWLRVHAIERGGRRVTLATFVKRWVSNSEELPADVRLLVSGVEKGASQFWISVPLTARRHILSGQRPERYELAGWIWTSDLSPSRRCILVLYPLYQNSTMLQLEP